MKATPILFVGLLLSQYGCSSLASGGDPSPPEPVIPEGWVKYDPEKVNFTFAGPEGFEFEAIKQDLTVGTGLFTPKISVPTGSTVIYGDNLEDDNMTKPGTGFIMVEIKPVDMKKSLDEIAEESVDPFQQQLMDLFDIKPDIEKEMLDLPMGSVLRIRESFDEEGANVSYYHKKDGKQYVFSFVNLALGDYVPIPSRRMMETLRWD